MFSGKTGPGTMDRSFYLWRLRAADGCNYARGDGRLAIIGEATRYVFRRGMVLSAL